MNNTEGKFEGFRVLVIYSRMMKSRMNWWMLKILGPFL